MRAIAALASGSTMTEAAEQAGVDRRTLHAWRRSDPEFIAELNRVRHEAAEKVRGELRGLASQAVATVKELLADSEAPAAVRLKAALTVLETVGGLKPQDLGLTDPEEVRRNLEQNVRMEAWVDRWNATSDAIGARMGQDPLKGILDGVGCPAGTGKLLGR